MLPPSNRTIYFLTNKEEDKVILDEDYSGWVFKKFNKDSLEYCPYNSTHFDSLVEDAFEFIRRGSYLNKELTHVKFFNSLEEAVSKIRDNKKIDKSNLTLHSYTFISKIENFDKLEDIINSRLTDFENEMSQTISEEELETLKNSRKEDMSGYSIEKYHSRYEAWKIFRGIN